MTSIQSDRDGASRTLRQALIRDLVEIWPEAMLVLSGYGIDVCCGGGLTIPAAAEAHGHDLDELLQRVDEAVRGEEHA